MTGKNDEAQAGWRREITKYHDPFRCHFEIVCEALSGIEDTYPYAYLTDLPPSNPHGKRLDDDTNQLPDSKNDGSVSLFHEIIDYADEMQ